MTRVRVYANLTKKIWSIKNHQPGDAGYGKLWESCKHARWIRLSDVEFKVSLAGRDRVRREKKKYVHAYAQGIASTDWLTQTPVRQIWQDKDLVMDHVLNYKRVSYNPYNESPHFYIEDTGEPIYKSSDVFMIYPEGDYPVVLARVSNHPVH